MGMARSLDDRGDAIRWYLHLRVSQELERSVSLSELARRTGINKVQLSQLMNSGKTGGGIVSLIRFAEYAGRTPGSMLDEALAWWEDGAGKKYAEKKAYDLAGAAFGHAPESSRRPSKPAAG